MSGSYNFLLHVLGFGLISAVLIGGWMIERKFRAEKDWALKAYIGGIARSLALLSPVAALILLITGIGNIHTYYMGSPVAWHEDGWLVAKVILFAVMFVNGTVFGPLLTKKRMGLVKALANHDAPAEAEQGVAALTRQIAVFYLVQFILWVWIVYLSTFGTGKHPGVF
jgi:hypothetical protein